MDMNELMERARAMQEKAAQMQRALEAVEVEGQAGGGLVRARLAGNGVLRRMEIDPSLLTAEDREILEDLIVAAHADAKAKLDERVAREMSQLTGGLGLPPGLV
jgi:DNA-binding YbaB/EbfC family protein